MAGTGSKIANTLRRSAGFYAAIAIVCWSTVATAFKWGLASLTPAALLFIATTSAIATLFLLLLAAGKRGDLFSIRRKALGRAALLGLINPFLYYLILFKAYSMLPAQVAQALNMIWPLVLVILSIPVLGQKIGWMSILAMIISFTGALFIALQGDPLALFREGLHIKNPWGVVLAMGSAFLWAIYFLLNMKNKLPDDISLFLNFLFAWIYLALFLLIKHITGPENPEFILSGISLRSVLSGVYIGIIEMAVPFIIWLKALKLAKNTAVVSSLIYIFPFLSLILIHYILGEPVYPSTVTGLILIVGGILLSRFTPAKQTGEKKVSF
ncbi:MAG TPA: DMT family transporter [Bacteroidales bacterium]|nr:DMT family transporter [Bacteroidales bacterium]HRW94394.1 DMT family transporter [Bacteroidales bacterium]